MTFPESVVAEQIDEILERATLRIAQQRIHVRKLREAEAQTSTAQAALDGAVAAFDRLSVYRAKFS